MSTTTLKQKRYTGTFRVKVGLEALKGVKTVGQIAQEYQVHPVYGSRQLTVLLQREDREINRKRVMRLLQLMGAEALYPKRSLSRPPFGWHAWNTASLEF